ncbi:hypothetical protein [Streptomyces sp. NPDC088789]|uniref:hypothetical protein n=1 Tax=Streptomyces sp. NPDC088789 TaxID=3365899 RepID=UPI00382F1457
MRGVLGATANPEMPDEAVVSRPSDVLAAKEATDDALSGLLLGLGAVALLVGGVGVADTMVISVLERRPYQGRPSVVPLRTMAGGVGSTLLNGARGPAAAARRGRGDRAPRHRAHGGAHVRKPGAGGT